MGGFLLTWGTLIVAVFALVQPWLVAVWKRLFRRLQVDVYESGAIEVGFSSFGPTIGLYGTLRARHGDAFIRSIELQLIREKDNARHQLRWGVFRSSAFGSQQQRTFQTCVSFLLTKDSATPYDIQFWDLDVQSEQRPLLEALRSAWAEAVMAAGGHQLLQAGADFAAIADELRQATRQLYGDFSQRQIHIDTFAALQRLCYWEPGWFTLELTVRTARPNGTFPHCLRFQLTAEQVSLLRINPVLVLQEACGQLVGTYNFVYPQYSDRKEVR